jgi:hypothetical protein
MAPRVIGDHPPLLCHQVHPFLHWLVLVDTPHEAVRENQRSPGADASFVVVDGDAANVRYGHGQLQGERQDEKTALSLSIPDRRHSDPTDIMTAY